MALSLHHIYFYISNNALKADIHKQWNEKLKHKLKMGYLTTRETVVKWYFTLSIKLLPLSYHKYVLVELMATFIVTCGKLGHLVLSETRFFEIIVL